MQKPRRVGVTSMTFCRGYLSLMIWLGLWPGVFGVSAFRCGCRGFHSESIWLVVLPGGPSKRIGS